MKDSRCPSQSVRRGDGDPGHQEQRGAGRDGREAIGTGGRAGGPRRGATVLSTSEAGTAASLRVKGQARRDPPDSPMAQGPAEAATCRTAPRARAAKAGQAKAHAVNEADHRAPRHEGPPCSEGPAAKARRQGTARRDTGGGPPHADASATRQMTRGTREEGGGIPQRRRPNGSASTRRGGQRRRRRARTHRRRPTRADGRSRKATPSHRVTLRVPRWTCPAGTGNRRARLVRDDPRPHSSRERPGWWPRAKLHLRIPTTGCDAAAGQQGRSEGPGTCEEREARHRGRLVALSRSRGVGGVCGATAVVWGVPRAR